MEDFFSNKLIERFEQMLEANEVYFFDSEEFLEIIEYYLDIADFEYAYKALVIAHEQYPDNITLKIKQLEYFVGIKDLKNAHILIEDLADLELTETDYLLALAMFWSSKDNHKKALHFYEKALENNEELDYIHNSIGNEYLELKETFKALHHFKLSLSINPADEYAFFSIIHCFDELHKPHDCIEFLHQYIDENPYSDTAWYQLGLKQVQIKKFTQAYTSFDFAVVINPESVINYVQKAYCLEELEYWEEALLVYQEALLYEESKAQILQKMGMIHLKLNDPLKALKIFLNAVQEDPQIEDLWSEISNIYENLGNDEEALHCIKKAIELDNKNAEFLRKLTYLHIKSQFYEEAIQDFHELLKLEPYNFNNHFAFSELLISIGEVDSAIDILEASIQKFKRAELYYQLSHCYFFKKDIEKGIEYLQNAFDINPKLINEMTEKYPILKDKTKVLIKK